MMRFMSGCPLVLVLAVVAAAKPPEPTRLGRSDIPPMRAARVGHTLTSIGDGTVFVVGGTTFSNHPVAEI
jgi:hypothetical protein